jgi:hypothetical protein
VQYAHRNCIQRWCDEKGDTVCEICLQVKKILACRRVRFTISNQHAKGKQNDRWIVFEPKQQFTPNYTATSKLFRNGSNTIFFRYLNASTSPRFIRHKMLESDRSIVNCSTHGYIQGRPMLTADQTSTSYGYDDETSTPTSVICCRIVALTVSTGGIYVDTYFSFRILYGNIPERPNFSADASPVAA